MDTMSVQERLTALREFSADGGVNVIVDIEDLSADFEKWLFSCSYFVYYPFWLIFKFVISFHAWFRTAGGPEAGPTCG